MYSQIHKQMYMYVFVLICAWTMVPLVISNKKYFQEGGVLKRLSEKRRTMYVESGQEARLKWEFATDKKIKFIGMSWEFYDPLDSIRRRLIWMDKWEDHFQSARAKNRTEYKVHLEDQATLVIPNVTILHQNTYVCIVPRTGMLDNIHSQVKLIVTEGQQDMPIKTTKSSPTLSERQPESTKRSSTLSEKSQESTKSKSSPTLTGNSTILRPTTVLLKSTHNISGNSTISRSTKVLLKTMKISGSTDKFKGIPVHNIIVEWTLPLLACALILLILLGFWCKRTIRKKRSRNQQSNAAHTNSNLILWQDASRLELDTEFDDQRDSIDQISWSGVGWQSGFSYQDSSEEHESNYSVANTSLAPSVESFPLVTFQTHNFPPTQNESWEIDRTRVRNLKRIGEGAFGLVAKAYLYGQNSAGCVEKCTVAVKTLKAFASPDDRRDLISEFELMRTITYHKNVVKLIGCVRITEPIWVITEYVCHGDLLGFLRKSRGIIDTTYCEKPAIPRTNLKQSQLLKMPRDVASGMAHLSHYKIIHRDLAARNVLVDENIQCKITDFGMARDIKSSNYYRKKIRGRIPLKWTAIEAIQEDKYTVASDVWSFGVLLYEVVTIGGQPYPGLGARELVRKLKDGWRMNRPPHVDLELYEIMKHCWENCPDDRPTFQVLEQKFNNLYGSRTDTDYINMKDYDETLYGNAEDTPENSSTSLINEVAVSN